MFETSKEATSVSGFRSTALITSTARSGGSVLGGKAFLMLKTENAQSERVGACVDEGWKAESWEMINLIPTVISVPREEPW